MKILFYILLLACPFVHFFMMRKSHKHSDEEHEMTEGEGKNKDDKNRSGHSCCH